MNNLKAAWLGRSVASRSLMIVLFAVALVATIVLAIWALRTDYQVLFAELDGRDAGAIVEELKRMKVPYKLADAGTKVLVPEKAVHETRLQLMGRGVPLAGGVGFEIFDNKDVGMTEYTQRINFQRALQGELARTIMAISRVKQARVHLVVPENSLFKREHVKPKASVTLLLQTGVRLENEQITGIQRLVAASVPRLEPGAVMVLDQRGVTLSAGGGEDEDYAAVSGKLRLKKDAEVYFARKISEVLDRTFGPGQAIVSVDVTLNLDEVKRTQQSIVPVAGQDGDEAGAVVRKRQSVYRQAKGPITKVNGEPVYAQTSPDLTSTTDVEYELGKSIEQVVSTPGGIRRISVGVIVPKLAAEQIERVQDVVSMVVGYSAARGDAISVQSIDQMLTAAPVPAAMEIESAPTPPMPMPMPAPYDWRALAQRVLADPVLLGAAAGSLLLVLGGLAVTFAAGRARRRRRRATEASEHQRQRRLVEIKTWLETERLKRLA